MATLAAMGEQMDSLNFRKQPGPGPERVPGSPLVLERPRTQEQGVCIQGKPPMS